MIVGQLRIFRAKKLAGWVDGRVGEKAGLRIAYSNHAYSNQKQSKVKESVNISLAAIV